MRTRQPDLLDDAGRGDPAWAPSYVGPATRSGPLTDADLWSGKALRELHGSLERAAAQLLVDKSGADANGDLEVLAGYRHLLVLLALGIDDALRTSDPEDPQITRGSVDAVLKWGMDCPDALYEGAPLRGDGDYVVRGHRGSARYLGLQVMGGMRSLANVVVDELELVGDRLELRLSATEHPGNWIPLSSEASSLIVRQFFYDWEREEPAELTIERLDRVDPMTVRRPGASVSAAGIANQLRRLGEFVEASVAFWSDMQAQLESGSLNAFREPAARTDLGGAEENVTAWGSWAIEPGQGLLVELTPPDALYWSIAIGNQWWESIDYAHHQSSLNGHQAVIDPDGVFRALICAEDPGIANWLDPAGCRRGPMIMRWVCAAGVPPVPRTQLVQIHELEDVLPAETARVTVTERDRILAKRRAEVRRRFGR